MFGRTYSEGWGLVVGVAHHPRLQRDVHPAVPPRQRRACRAATGATRREFQTLNVASTAGASLLAFGFLIILVYLVVALSYGEKVGRNPWGSRGYEWNSPSPPPKHNFDCAAGLRPPAARLRLGRSRAGDADRSARRRRKFTVTRIQDATPWLSTTAPRRRPRRAPPAPAAPLSGHAHAAARGAPRDVAVPGDGNPALRRALLRLLVLPHALSRGVARRARSTR